MILILSNEGDRTTEEVEKHLTEMGELFLTLHGEAWPDYRVETRPSDGVLSIDHPAGNYDLTDVDAIWNRRPTPPLGELAEEWGMEPEDSEFEFVAREWYGWIKSLRLTSATWVNDPDANRRAESKVEQLSIARSLGFEIPETVVSNEESTFREALQGWGGRGVAKALTTGAVGEPVEAFVFTTTVTVEDIDQDGQIEACPFIIQEELRPKTDYRVTVLGDQTVTCEIRPRPGKNPPVDWREDQDSYALEEVTLPQSVSEKCVELASSLDLRFAAIDLIKHGDEFYFIEVNPNGQWGWLNPHLKTDLPQAFASFLSSFTGG